MSKRIFANLGFLLQIAGLLTVLPIGVGLYFDETQTVISLFLTCVTFLGCGFLLNALCKRKDLDFKSSNVLFLVTFILIPLIDAFINNCISKPIAQTYIELWGWPTWQN
jgi:uncharacterized membrane protein